MGDFRSVFRRYEGLIEPFILGHRGLVVLVPEKSTAVRVERGAIWAESLHGSYSETTRMLAGRLIDLTRKNQHPIAEFFDAGGHGRAVYRPLTIYAWLQSFRRLYEVLPRQDFGRWEEALRAWADFLEADLGCTSWADDLPAAVGDRWAEMAWSALALHVAGKVFVRDVWVDLASDAFGRLTRAQQPDGAFLLASQADQPETRWYHELQILHAAAGYAVQAEDRMVASAVVNASRYHLAETQPDHATTQPWALFPFLWNANARPLADQLLHTAQLQQAGRMDGLSLMLLADCLYCLRLFT